MRIELEAHDLEAIAEKVIAELRPLLSRPNRPDDSIFDVKDLCEYLKVSPKWVHERTHLKEIPYVKLSNKTLRFRKSEIDKWLESLKTPAIKVYEGSLKAIGR